MQPIYAAFEMVHLGNGISVPHTNIGFAVRLSCSKLAAHIRTHVCLYPLRSSTDTHRHTTPPGPRMGTVVTSFGGAIAKLSEGARRMELLAWDSKTMR